MTGKWDDGDRQGEDRQPDVIRVVTSYLASRRVVPSYLASQRGAPKSAPEFSAPTLDRLFGSLKTKVPTIRLQN